MSDIEVNGITLSFDDIGEGPAILLLHAAYLSRRQWRPQFQTLAAQLRMIAPDLRGHGQSSKPPGKYSIDLFAEDIFQLLVRLEIHEAILCGHAMGGMVAQQLAVDHPELVQSLILAETNYGTRSTKLEAIMTNLLAKVLLRIGIKRLNRLNANTLSRKDADLKRVLEQDMDTYLTEPDIYWQITNALLNFQGREQLKRITSPTLVIVAALNRPTHRQASVLAKEITEARMVVIPSAAHLLNWENAADFNQALLEFILSLEMR
jgi:3-oxoadipate enol-lactonase